MPPQKRSLQDDNAADPPPLNAAVNHHHQQDELQQQNDDTFNGHDNEHQQQDENEDEEEEKEEEEDDDDYEKEEAEEDDGELISSPVALSSDNDDDDDIVVDDEKFILVKLSDIRKEVQCPICLGIIRKTRTVMECLHRFCRECIDKSMRMGNNECPACRTHCASRRSLRDDPNYDALISAIYPDIDQYEEEELAFQEEERVRNKQIQAAIAQTFRRQTEALSKKRRRSQGNYRRRRNFRSEEDDALNGHDGGGKDSSSADERCTEPKPKRAKRWQCQPSPAGASGDGGDDENEQEVQREVGVAPPALVGSAETLSWGKGGIRSNTRHGSASGGNGKHSRSRLARLNEHLRSLEENDNEMDIQVVLVSLDQQKELLLEHSYLCGRPALSVGQLCQFIALQTSLPPEKLEILAARGMQVQTSTSTAFEASKDEFQVLDSKETLSGLKAACNFARGHLLLAYRKKL